MLRLILALMLIVPIAVHAAEYERLLLPVMPSTVYCAYDSRYETTLLLFNQGPAAAELECFSLECPPIEAGRGAVLRGPVVGVPLPSFFYVRRDDNVRLSASLLVESSHHGGGDRFFTQLPVVGESAFTEQIEFVGVRMDPDYRQTLRVYADQSGSGTAVRMRVYRIDTGELTHEHDHGLHLNPLPDDVDFASIPAFTMECNLSELDPHLVGQQYRITLDTGEAKVPIWGFISVTSNATQHFYTVLPQP